jgi:acetoin utilization deacetylase AcuC-like enzyme
MKLFVNHLNHLHAGRMEMHRGQMVTCVESTARLESVLTALRERAFPEPLRVDANATQLASVLPRIHDPQYLAFLTNAWANWVGPDPTRAAQDLLPDVWPTRGMRQDRVPENFAAQVGYYAFDSGSPITSGTWAAAYQGAACAVAAAQAVAAGEGTAVALTRPPGHHAGPDFFGGYCFLNNAALAAQTLRDNGLERVAILDVDYHHGNGTQTIFEARDDVFTLSIHGDPTTEYPFFLGHADERGVGAGLGHNRNWPLPHGSGEAAWFDALTQAGAAVQNWGAQALVVPLGLDAYADDPISGFTLTSEDFVRLGKQLRGLRLPTVFTLEGGYATAALGHNAANVLAAFAP